MDCRSNSISWTWICVVAVATWTGEPSTRARAQDVPTGSVTAAEQEEAEIAEELAQARSPQEQSATGATASSRGLSNLLNPAISGNGLLLGGYTSRDDANVVDGRDDLETGFTIQELEVAFSAIVDPYFRADLTLTANLDEIGFEEAYVTTLDIPRVTIRGGLFKVALGRHNLLHTHRFPFITGPLPWRAALGPEGLASPGLSFDLLLPLPFYAEVTAQVFAGDWGVMEGGIEDDPMTPLVDESVPDMREAEDFGYVAHLKTLFDLSGSTTLELGASYLGGRNGFGGLTTLVAGDVTLKWQPVAAGRYTSFEWQTEWLWLNRADAPGERPTGGGYTHVRFQFEQRWWTQLRGAVLGVPGTRDDRTYRGELMLAYVPSEFSALRLQYGLERDERADAPFVHDVLLQMVFSIGPHPAHAY